MENNIITSVSDIILVSMSIIAYMVSILSAIIKMEEVLPYLPANSLEKVYI
jgi:hypothetical protein